MIETVDGLRKGRGAFILFEGLDRAGKTTHANALVNWLNKLHTDEFPNTKARYLRFPDLSQPSGQLLQRYINKEVEMEDKAVHRLFSDNRRETMEGISNNLKQGMHIICDRYAPSGVAYSAAKGMDFDWCMQDDAGLLCPDAILYLNVPVDVLKNRHGFGEGRFEHGEFQGKVLDAFQALRMKCSDLPWKMINSEDSFEHNHEIIQKLAIDIMRGCSESPLRRLWDGQSYQLLK